MHNIYRCSLVVIVLLLGSSSQAFAQQVNKKALEKANWYSSPREFQIIDDRPVVKDLREPSQPAGTVDLGSPAGGAQAGANSTIPAGGLHLGPPSVRAASDGLPRSAFGSNIPSGGLAPAGGLPSAGTRSYASSLSAPAAGRLPGAQSRSYVPFRGAPATLRGPVASTHPAPAVKSYGSYSTAPATRASSSSEQLKVRGRLLRSK